MPYWLATAATSEIAVIWGTPVPVTTRVVQMDAGPTPTFTASAPAFIRSSAAAAVAMLPAITGTSNSVFNLRSVSMTPAECPWALSSTSTSTPAATTSCARLMPSTLVPTAAPTRRRPFSSFVASGNWIFLAMSFTVISPLEHEVAVYYRHFFDAMVAQDIFRLFQRGAYRNSDEIFLRQSRSVQADRGSPPKRISRLVRMPTSLPFSVMGTPEMW